MFKPIISEWRQIGRDLRPALPGLYLVIAVAVVARYLHEIIPNAVMARAISEVFIAVFLGLYIRNAIRFSTRFDAGIKFALQRILRLGIILLGLRLSLQDVVSTGVTALILIVACMAVALTLAYFAGRLLKIPPRLAALIGVGTAICGNTAIVAVAPVIEAKEEDVSFAVATITFFGTLAVVLYPIIGYFLGVSDRTFGLWVGTAVNDTSQVVAAGAAFSDTARDIATVVKLTRNTLMAPLIVVIGMVYARSQNRKQTGATASVQLRQGRAVVRDRLPDHDPDPHGGRGAGHPAAGRRPSRRADRGRERAQARGRDRQVRGAHGPLGHRPGHRHRGGAQNGHQAVRPGAEPGERAGDLQPGDDFDYGDGAVDGD